MKKIQRVIISPHFDDACLSAFDAITPSTLLVTVFGGEPKTIFMGWWDTTCGFANSHDAVIKRKKENVYATKKLGCSVINLPFPDHQYEESVDSQELQIALLSIFLAHPDAVFYVPYGVGGHTDHMMVKQAMIQLAHAISPSIFIKWKYYVDLPYGFKNKNVPWKKVHDAHKKWQIALSYTSQIMGMQAEYPEWNEEAFSQEAILPFMV